ncbi:MAG: hypothetical protein A3F89_05840 [Deltaproteobacteria bacterium RIFCSPLOWO2_12_FULL_50_11]|nr:MAG: hypothetical protein A3F89_05840 [Deltaproteobacteria bacterium RIFCSPLOWO2_12_FULL_50_11]
MSFHSLIVCFDGVKKGLPLAFVFFLCMTFFLPLHLEAKKRSSSEKKEIESLFLWSHQFPGALLYLELTPHGWLHAVAREGKGKKSPERRFLLNSEGRVVWEGPVAMTALLADNPFPVIMEVQQTGLVFRAINSSGSESWRYPLEGIPASTIMDPSSKTMLMVMMPYEWGTEQEKSYQADFLALDLQTGTVKWKTPLGEIRGSLTSFGGEMALSDDSLWWAAGGRAACLRLSTGESMWNIAIPRNDEASSEWIFTESGAFMAKGGHILSFSPQGALQWETLIKEGLSLNGFGRGTSGIAASFVGEKKVDLVVLDPVSGKILWQKDFKHNVKKEGPPPRGLVVSHDRVSLAMDQRLIGFELSSGEEVYSHKLKNKIFQGLNEIRSFDQHFVLVGFDGVRGYGIKDGKKLWEQTDFVDPVFEIRKTREATLSVALSGMQGGLSPGAKKAWKEYESGSRDFTSAAMEASFQQQMYRQQQQAQNQRATKNLSGAIGKFAEIDLTLVNRRLGSRYAQFYRHRGSSFMNLKNVEALDGALVDLTTGEVHVGGVKDSKTACVSQLLVDPEGQRIIQAYRQMALMCKDEDLIEVYRFTP